MARKEEAVIRLCGDSGDGIQLVGSALANTSALIGNDIGTLPDFPAEIRAPRGSLAGVSGYQLNVSSRKIYTPGDKVDCLVAFNPAALKTNVHYLKNNGVLIVDVDTFSEHNLKIAKYEKNPLESGVLDAYQTIQIQLTKNTRDILAASSLSHKEKDRCKNFYALGLISWLYNRPINFSKNMIENKFQNRKEVVQANLEVLKGGYAYGEMTETHITRFYIKPANLPPGKYRSISGNMGMVFGLLAAAEKSGRKLFYSGYPITPASDILHELFRFEGENTLIFQAEDEIAAICAAIGASYSGALGVTASSGPGISLKLEGINLAVMTELPLLIINVQRAGPSTGMPTKTEQADLSQALFGRNGDAPIPVIASAQATDSFDTTYEALRIALLYRVPVMLLSDAYIANGAAPWLIPDLKKLPKIDIKFATDKNHFAPYKREPNRLAREFAIPGMKGFEHCIGGLEKEDETGNVSYEPENHQKMTKIRNKKIRCIQMDIGKLYIDGPRYGEVLILGWGSTFGVIKTTVNRIRKKHPNKKVTHIHLRWLNPLHASLESSIYKFRYVLVPEMNMGQLSHVLRAKYLVETHDYNQVKGIPLQEEGLMAFIEQFLLEKNGRIS